MSKSENKTPGGELAWIVVRRYENADTPPPGHPILEKIMKTSLAGLGLSLVDKKTGEVVL